MVFSFFKKDAKDSKTRSAREAGDTDRGRRVDENSAPQRASTAPDSIPPKAPVSQPGADPINSSSTRRRGGSAQRFTATESTPPNRELQRTLAMETAAKIDAIESEMARDFLKPPGSRSGVSSSSASGAAAGTAAAADDSFDASTDVFLGSVDAIEINTSGAGGIIDETAILFANGQQAAAEQVLRAGIEADDLGHSAQNAWMMLFELINQRGERAAYEDLATKFAGRFGTSAPAWFDYQDAAPSAARAAAAPVAEPMATPAPHTPDDEATVKLPAQVGADVIKTLEQLKVLAATYPALTLDASAVRSTDLPGAELLLRVVTAFKRASHQLAVVGAEQVLVSLRGTVQPGRRDASDGAWMLMLEMLRLLDRQHDFEEMSIQYCITFEVSPPQWEPAPANLSARPALPQASAPAPVAVAPVVPEPIITIAPMNGLDWRGTIEGEGEPWFGRMAAEARNSKELVVECAHMRRMAFSAGSALLTQVMKLQQSGVRLEFNNVNYLVGALLQLLGVTAIATVHLRHA